MIFLKTIKGTPIILRMRAMTIILHADHYSFTVSRSALLRI
jgi:hypothetical protein